MQCSLVCFFTMHFMNVHSCSRCTRSLTHHLLIWFEFQYFLVNSSPHLKQEVSFYLLFLLLIIILKYTSSYSLKMYSVFKNIFYLRYSLPLPFFKTHFVLPTLVQLKATYKGKGMTFIVGCYRFADRDIV